MDLDEYWKAYVHNNHIRDGWYLEHIIKRNDWSIRKETLSYLLSIGCRGVKLLDMEGIEHTATLGNLALNGKPVSKDKQYISLKSKYWEISRPCELWEEDDGNE